MLKNPKYWTDYLVCGISSVVIDEEQQTVRFNVPDMNCTDMTGAIELAKLALPEVKLVEVRSPDRYADCDYTVNPDLYIPRGLHP